VSAGDLLGGWHVNGALTVIAAVAIAYAIGARRAHRWPAWRPLAFGTGLVVLAVALLSGIDVWADGRLSVHMVQHLLLTFVAAPLLVLGAPVRLALATTSRPTGRAITRIASGRTGLLLHPLVAAIGFAAATLLLHLPAVYDAAVRSDWIHALVHAAFLATALIFWTPLLAPEPLARRMSATAKLVYLILAMPAMAVVGVVMNSSSGAIYSAYPDVADQQLAGALMWIGGGTVLGAAFLVCGWLALLAEERRAIAREMRGGSA
jgi:putative membrane protein